MASFHLLQPCGHGGCDKFFPVRHVVQFQKSFGQLAGHLDFGGLLGTGGSVPVLLAFRTVFRVVACCKSVGAALAFSGFHVVGVVAGQGPCAGDETIVAPLRSLRGASAEKNKMV